MFISVFCKICEPNTEREIVFVFCNVYLLALDNIKQAVKGRIGHVSTSFCKSKDNFDRFWEHTLKESKELRIEDPKLKRKEEIPKKIANFIHQD